MDPAYQQLMIQQLMGQGSAPQGMGGQNPTSPYGMSFMTGNQSMPNSATMAGQQGNMGMLNQAAPGTQLQQANAVYSGV